MSENLASVEDGLVPPEATEPTTEQQTPPPAVEPQTNGSPEAQEEQPGETEAASEALSSDTAPPVQETPTQTVAMDHVFTEEYTYQRPKRGELRQGRVIAVRNDGIVVDLGLKREGFIPSDDLQRVDAEAVESLSPGDEIPVYVLRPEDDREGNILVSWQRARQEQDWTDAARLQETGEIWEGKIKGYNRGGLIVLYGKIRGFVPASHITGISRRIDQAGLQARLSEMVGRTMPLKALEVDRQNRRLIFSERAARREWRVRQREKLLNELQEGDHVHGVVSNICDFGVFVDIGGTDGLVHISELSWRRTNHPSELLKIGDEVDAYVLNVDRERRRIGLSLRLMQPDPWELVDQQYQVGQLVTGVITKLITFGAFAALQDGIEGLIHISELAEVPPKHPSEVVNPGDVVPLHVVKIDSRRRRIGLSLKHVSEEEWAEWESQRQEQAEAAGQVEAAEEVPPAAEELLEQAEPSPPPAQEMPAVVEELLEQPEPPPPFAEETPAVVEELQEQAEPSPPPAEEMPAVVEELLEQPEPAPPPAEEMPAVVEEPLEQPEPSPPPAEETPAVVEEVLEQPEPPPPAEEAPLEPPDELLTQVPPPDEEENL